MHPCQAHEPGKKCNCYNRTAENVEVPVGSPRPPLRAEPSASPAVGIVAAGGASPPALPLSLPAIMHHGHSIHLPICLSRLPSRAPWTICLRWPKTAGFNPMHGCRKRTKCPILHVIIGPTVSYGIPAPGVQIGTMGPALHVKIGPSVSYWLHVGDPTLESKQGPCALLCMPNGASCTPLVTCGRPAPGVLGEVACDGDPPADLFHQRIAAAALVRAARAVDDPRPLCVPKETHTAAMRTLCMAAR
jgi:hypothetical protein